MFKVAGVTLFLCAAWCGALENGNMGSPAADGLPAGWVAYGRGGSFGRENGALRLRDLSRETEWGISQKFAAGPGKYEASVELAVPADSASAAGIRFQLRALPSNHFTNIFPRPTADGEFHSFRVGLEAPAGTTALVLYLYSSYQDTADFLAKNAGVEKVEAFSETAERGDDPAAAKPKANVLLNEELADRNAENVPAGWRRYGKAPLQVKDGFLYILDPDDGEEAGINQRIPITEPGKYELTVHAALPDDEASEAEAYVQLRIQPQNIYRQRPLSVGEVKEFVPTTVGIEAPAGTTAMDVYIYSRKAGTPRFLLSKAEFRKVENFTPATATGLTPEIKALKTLSLETPLIAAGKPDALIAPGSTPAARQAAEELRRRLGAAIVDPAAVPLPLTSHVIAIGARENNDLLNRLYRRGFCYTDSAYPGPGGHELRSLHNPTGGNFNVIIVGGSDEPGIAAAAALLNREIGRNTTLGHLMQLKVPGFEPYPFDAYNFGNFHSRMVSGISCGYGWNYIAAQMALFYQTGDERYAKEFLRLAFPDAQAIRDFQKFNPESLEDPARPLSSPYHYTGHQLILLWDLIEEHPVFSDEERLKVTRALAAQLDHEGIGRMAYSARPTPQRFAGSRHSQWANICLYALARYFVRDYPNRTWSRALAAAENSFVPANLSDGWIEGERGIVNWFLSGSVNPALQFLALAGDGRFNPDGGLANALKFFETQWDGSGKSAILGTASRQTFYLAAEQTGDGKYLYYADLLPSPLPTTRIGASFRPDGEPAAREPSELLNCWTAAPMKKGEYDLFQIKAPPENVYLGLAWRDALGGSGDLLSFNCFNEEYRTPFKLLSISNFRLDGKPVLSGLGNFCQIYLAGSTEAHIPTVGQVYGYGAVGDTVYFSGGVPDHAYAAWRRDLLLRKRNFLLLADTVTPREKQAQDLTCRVNFQTAFGISETTPKGELVLHNGLTLPVSACRLSTAGGDYPISSGSSNTLFQTEKPGDRAVIVFQLDKDFSGELRLSLMQHSSRAGSLNVYLNGVLQQEKVPHYQDGGDFSTRIVRLENQPLKRGTHTLELEVAEAGATTAWIGAMNLEFLPGVSSRLLVRTGGAEIVPFGADSAAARRQIPADPAQPTTTFTLIAEDSADAPVTVSVLTANSALLQLPEPALAFTGEAPGFGKAALALLEKDRAAGFGATALTGFFTSSAPVAFDWDFSSGRIVLDGEAGVVVRFADGHSEQLTGSPLVADRRPAAGDLAQYRDRLAGLKGGIAGNEETLTKTPARTRVLRTFDEKLNFIQPVEIDGRPGLLAAAGNRLLRLDTGGRIEQTFLLSDTVTAATWFPAAGAVVAGSKDDKVTAFSLQGKPLWSFTSELAPEVEATQKYYWFKPAYPGIHALAAAGDRLYIGSACTMEVLDQHGKLQRRYAHTWGPSRQIAVISASDGSRNAVGLRHSASDGNYMWSVNDRSGESRVAFRDNLPGFKNFPSFGSLYRTRAFVADFDGDGREELFADSQGMYLWVNVYDGDGKAKYQLNLGPGDKNMGKVFTSLAAGDFTGDERPEVVLVSVARELLAIDGRARPLWSASLPFGGGQVAILPKAAGGGEAAIAVVNGRQLALYSGSGSLKGLFELPEGIQGILATPDRRILLWSERTLSELVR